MIMRKVFRGELKKLHDLLLDMNLKVKSNVELMAKAIANYSNAKIAREVIENDDIVDRLEIEIEEACVEILIRQQPVAGDLREITAILKMITDLERISDYCSYVCEHLLKFKDNINEKCICELKILSSNAKNMFVNMMDGYMAQNNQILEQVNTQDTISDNAFSNLKKSIISSNNYANSEDAINLILIGRALERMADHITNVCDWIFFKLTGNFKP